MGKPSPQLPFISHHALVVVHRPISRAEPVRIRPLVLRSVLGIVGPELPIFLPVYEGTLVSSLRLLQDAYVA